MLGKLYGLTQDQIDKLQGTGKYKSSGGGGGSSYSNRTPQKEAANNNQISGPAIGAITGGIEGSILSVLYDRSK